MSTSSLDDVDTVNGDGDQMVIKTQPELPKYAQQPMPIGEKINLKFEVSCGRPLIYEWLKQGMREGVTYARQSLGGVDAQFEALQGQVEDSPFYVRFRDMPGSLGRHVVSRTKTEGFNITENQIMPAFRKLQEFLKYEYSSALRSPPGVSSIPDGGEFYQATLRWHLGTNLTPQEVNNLSTEPDSPLTSFFFSRFKILGSRR